MKKYLLSVFLSGGLLFSACSLKEHPYGFYSDDNFYKSEADFNSALLYAYDALTFIEYARTYTLLSDVPTDVCNYKPTGDPNVRLIDLWNYSQFDTNDQFQLFFKYLYVSINRANSVIKKTEESSVLSEGFKNEILGKAYFLRAWNYYNLVRNFGLVPLYVHPVQTASDARQGPPANMDAMYDFMIADGVRAVELLGIKKVSGLADKVAAQSLLAKLYITLASSKESEVRLYKDMQRDVQQMYDSAAHWAAKVVNDQTAYRLDNDLMNIYDVDANGPEQIFTVNMDRTGVGEGNFSQLDKMFLPFHNGNPFYLKNPDGTFSKSMDGWDGIDITDQFASQFHANDKRKLHLMTKTIYNAADNNSPVGLPRWKTRKYLDPKAVGNKSSVKPFLIRFSDIALIYAEAVGPTTQGYNWLNKIRTRANVPEAPAGMSVNQFRDYIIQERAFELYAEGHRLYDLRRKAAVTQKDPYAMSANISEDEASFFPIPRKELDLNTGIEK